MKDTLTNNEFQNSTASDAEAYRSSIPVNFSSTSSEVSSITVPFFDVISDPSAAIPATVFDIGNSFEAREPNTPPSFDKKFEAPGPISGHTSYNALRAPQPRIIPSSRSAFKPSRSTTASSSVKNFSVPGPSNSGSIFKAPQSRIIPSSRSAFKPSRSAIAPRFIRNLIASETSTVSTGSAFKTLRNNIVSNSRCVFKPPQLTKAPIFGNTSKAAKPGVEPSFGSTFGTPGPSIEPTFGSTFGAAGPSTVPYFDSNFGTPFTFTNPGMMNLFSTQGTTSNLVGRNSTTYSPSFFGTPGTLGLFGNIPPSVSYSGVGGNAPSANLASTINPSSFFMEFNLLSSRLNEFRIQNLKNDKVLASICEVNIYGDERDAILKKWNMLQARWGSGKGYYSNTQPCVEYDHTNQFYQFKAISYGAMPMRNDSDGFVKLYFYRKASELSPQKEVLIKVLVELLGNRPDQIVNIHEIRPTAVEESEMLISVSEKGSNRRVHATDLANYLKHPFRKQRLDCLGVLYIYAHVKPKISEIQRYLRVPPPGIDILTWRRAQYNNPQPDKYLPLPVFGLLGLANRAVCQKYTAGIHRELFEKTYKEIIEAKKKYTFSLIVIVERKYKFLESQNKVLKILVKESLRKDGRSIQTEKNAMAKMLEFIGSRIVASKRKMEKLIDSMLQLDGIRLPTEQHAIDPAELDGIRQYLQKEQTEVQKVIDIFNCAFIDLNIIKYNDKDN